jgi:hypothetical protein
METKSYYRYRTSINYCESYKDTISHPSIISTYNYLYANHNELLRKCNYVSIRISPDNINIFIQLVSKSSLEETKVYLDKLHVSGLKNIYFNDIYYSGLEYVYECFLIDSKVISQYQKPHCFFQSRLDIRQSIYGYLSEIGKANRYDHIYLFGGEFYLYSQIFENNLECYTDCLDLYRDALYNNPNLPIRHIDYNMDTLDIQNDDSNNLLVINVSRNGLKKNLGETIKKIRGHIVYIGCKQNIVERDIEYLERNVIYHENFNDTVFLLHLK